MQNPLLLKAMMLYAMHYCVMHTITFTDTSAAELALKFPDAARSQGTSVSARILSRQIKYVIFVLIEEMTAELLTELDAEMKLRTRSSWAVSVCAILLLCLCMQEIQAAVSVVIRALPEDDYTEQDRSKYLKMGLDMEDQFRWLTTCFHFIYSTHEKPHQKSFNPLRDGLALDVSLEWSEHEAAFVRDIRDIMTQYGKPVTLLLVNHRAKNFNF
jgi:hypothetical protein